MIYDIRVRDITLRDFINECAISMDIPNDGSHQLFIGEYDHESCELKIVDLTSAMLEEDFTTIDIGYTNTNKVTARMIFIGKDKCEHTGAPRMKVSPPIDRARPTKAKRDRNYLSISIDDNGASYDIHGSAKKINISNKEIKFYFEIAKRNSELLKIASDENKEKAAARAMVNDELLRRDGNTVTRDASGNAKVYDKSGKLLYTLRLEDIIK